jgi:hypothetical protein
MCFLLTAGKGIALKPLGQINLSRKLILLLSEKMSLSAIRFYWKFKPLPS